MSFDRILIDDNAGVKRTIITPIINCYFDNVFDDTAGTTMIHYAL